jgi:acetoin utilization deacetylase AcuC-like enzyme
MGASGGSAALAGVRVAWSPDCLRHDPESEIWVGVRWPATEVAARLENTISAAVDAGAQLVDVTPADLATALDRLVEVHDPALVAHLRAVHAEWQAAGMPERSGQSRVVPYVFPTEAMLDGLPLRRPVAVHARSGQYCYDTMTLVGPGTWPAAHAAAAAAVRAAALAAQGGPAGGRLTFAALRPPGHHVTRAAYGGSCYLNNAAVAVAELLARGASRVAVVDLDAHHGNGTQQIFYDRPDVSYASVHVDPGAGWFPHYAGFADETGTGAGRGSTLNVPLAPGSDDGPWLAAVDRLVEATAAFGPDALVVSLGVDAEAGDPESPLEVSPAGYHQAGRRLAALAAAGPGSRPGGMPVVAVQEGGYRLETVGPLVVGTLAGLAGTFPP